MNKYLSKQFFALALLVPLLSYPLSSYAEQREKTLEQQQELQETDIQWVQLQPEVIASIQEASKSMHPDLQELLIYATDTDVIAPYHIALAAVDAALEYHTKNNTLSNAKIVRDYKQALITGTAIIPQDQEDTSTTRGLLRERCFPSIRTRLLRANRVCTNELGANNATINNLRVTGNQTIDGNLTVNGTINNNNNNTPINPSDLCTNGVLNLPCDLNVGGDLTVTGTINGTINPASLCAGGSLTLPCDLNVTGNSTVGGNQTITGLLTVNNNTIINGNETINGNLTVTGTITGIIDPASLCSGGSLALPCNLTVTGDTTVNGDLTVTGTITGIINPASLCSGGVAIFPCNLQFNSTNNTLNSIGNSAEPVLNLIRGTIAPNLTAVVTLVPLEVSITNTPTIIAGSGFTVAATPPINILGLISIGALIGTIDVTFDPGVQFASRPSITLGTEDAPGAILQTQLFDYRITNVTTTGFSIEIINLLGIPLIPGLTLLAGNINFMAIGPTVGS